MCRAGSTIEYGIHVYERGRLGEQYPCIIYSPPLSSITNETNCTANKRAAAQYSVCAIAIANIISQFAALSGV